MYKCVTTRLKNRTSQAIGDGNGRQLNLSWWYSLIYMVTYSSSWENGVGVANRHEHNGDVAAFYHHLLILLLENINGMAAKI